MAFRRVKAAIGAKRARPDPSEHIDQVGVVNWARANERRCPALELLHATPNGGERHPAVAAKLQAEGVSRGFPDLSLPVPRCNFAGLHIEMKRASFGTTTAGGYIYSDQVKWLRRLLQNDSWAVVCRGRNHAVVTIMAYVDRDLEQLKRLDAWWQELDVERFTRDRPIRKAKVAKARRKAA